MSIVKTRTASAITLSILAFTLTLFLLLCFLARDLIATAVFQPQASPEQLRNHTQQLLQHGCIGCHQVNTTAIDDLPQRLSALFAALPRPDFTRKALGSSLCVVDIDSRHYDHTGQILSDTFDWTQTDALSAGMMNHFMYASIHGYTHHIIRSQEWLGRDRDDVWSKLPIILRLLDSCQVVLAVDSDVVFQHLDLPFEWLLDHWNITADVPLALPWDTQRLLPEKDLNLRHQSDNYDDKGEFQLNAGVVVAQDLDETREVLKAWIECPDKVDGCAKYRHDWPAEQGVFNNYVRYAWPNSFRTIPCDDANGFPDQPSECNGKYLSHFTTYKSMTKDNVAHVSMEALARLFTVHRLHTMATDSTTLNTTIGSKT